METHDRSARRAKLTLAGLAVLAAAGLAAGGVAAYSLFGNDHSGQPHAGSSTTVKPAPSGSASEESGAAMTPEKGKKVPLSVPTGQRDGVSTGFPHNYVGAISAAVYFWEEYAFLDDQKARQQLMAVVSPDATGYVDEQISEVRKMREGANLPPSGGTPAGITFTTTVNAVRARTLTSSELPRGDVIHIWMNYDRYATTPEESTDDDPLKGEDIDFIVKWQGGAWKLTNETSYWKQRTFPVAYFPESSYAWRDMWWQVRHED